LEPLQLVWHIFLRTEHHCRRSMYYVHRSMYDVHRHSEKKLLCLKVQQ
jgi:hypothetical protein